MDPPESSLMFEGGIWRITIVKPVDFQGMLQVEKCFLFKCYGWFNSLIKGRCFFHSQTYSIFQGWLISCRSQFCGGDCITANPSQRIFFPGLKMNQENSPEKYVRFTLLPRFVFGKVGYCPCFPSGYLLPDGYPRPQRIRDGLEEIEGVSKPQQLQISENFPPNGRRNWLEHHFAKYHSCIFFDWRFFLNSLRILEGHTESERKVFLFHDSPSQLGLIFIGPPVFQVSKGLHPILLGKYDLQFITTKM